MLAVNYSWEQRKLGDIADIIGGGTPSTSVADYWDGEIDWYAPAEISDQILVKSSQRKITQEGFDNSSAKMLPVGTVLFTSRAGIGKTAILGKEACTNQGFQSIVPHKNELDSYFIYSRTPELKKYGETVGAGSTFVEVSGKQMAAMTLMMPPTIEEQKRIGEFMSNIDEAITLHQCKAYSNIMAVLLVITPKFYSWEQRKFVDITYATGKRNKKNLPLEPFAITNDRGFVPQNEAHDEFGYMKEVDRSMYMIVEPNSFAYNPARINVGSLGYYDGQENVVVSSLYEVFQTTEDIDDTFLSHWFKTKIFHNWIERLQEGSVRLYFYYDKLCECKIMIPSVQEQKKIGAALEQLDQSITLHQCQ